MNIFTRHCLHRNLLVFNQLSVCFIWRICENPKGMYEPGSIQVLHQCESTIHFCLEPSQQEGHENKDEIIETMCEVVKLALQKCLSLGLHQEI